MSGAGKEFVGLLPPKEQRPLSSFFGKAAFKNILRDNFSISTWLCLGASAQSLLFLAFGRVALLPAIAILFYRTFVAYAMSIGWMRNTYMDGVILKKFSSQLPDESGHYGSKPSDSDIVVFMIGAQCNHPMGLVAPGNQKLGDYFTQMIKELEERADEFGFLGLTSWLNSSDRETQSMSLQVGYFKSVEGLHKYAHSDLHRESWDWWNRHYKEHPHITIYHEMYHVPRGHWENIYVNSHPALINTITKSYIDEKTGKKMWASPVVDASRGLLKTSAGRMARSQADEHDKYETDPYQ